MQRFRHIPRTCLILVLIPLTVLSGRVIPGCICSDGHFEPLCNGGNCCCGPVKSAKTDSCGCRKCCKTANGTAASCCSRFVHPNHFEQSTDADDSQSRCHPLTLSPMIAEDDSAVHSSVELPVFSHVGVAVLPPVILEQIAIVPLVDSGPPRVRLYALLSLLI